MYHSNPVADPEMGFTRVAPPFKNAKTKDNTKKTEKRKVKREEGRSENFFEASPRFVKFL